MVKTRQYILGALFLAAAMRAMLPLPALAVSVPAETTTSTLATAADLDALLAGIHEIAAPGVPGALAVLGAGAFPVAVGGAGKNVRVPVVAAARAALGRVVAFGHTGYSAEDALKAADTRRLMENSIRWASAKQNPQVAVSGDAGLLNSLLAHGFHAEERRTENLRGTDVLILSAHDITEAQVEPLKQWVQGGGGLITLATGWGWEQLNPGRSLAADFPANRLLAPWGLVFTGGMLDRTSQAGFLTEPRPERLTAANLALDRVFQSLQGPAPIPADEVAQVETVITQAAQALPPGDKILLPRLQELTHGMPGDVVPFPGKPVVQGDVAARLLLTLQTNTLMALPAAAVRAHPAGAIFPGEVPEDAKRVKETLSIDTAIPDWHSLGLYAAPGALLTVQIPAEAARKGLGVRIGAHTDSLWNLDQWKRAPEISRSFALDETETKAANAFGGLVYITVPQNCKLGEVSVTVSGAVPSPLFVRGHTSMQEWHDEIRKCPGPWAELATDKIILTVPSRVVRTLDDPEALMQYWDAGMDAVADLAGIPHERKRPERIVADRQISAGYMHSGYPIMTFLDVSEMDVDLTMLMKGDWGHWHEMGHNHQVSDWTFEGTGEVSNNMFPLYVNQMVAHIPGGLAHPNVQPAWQKKAIADYRARGAHFEEWKSNPFLALAMYIQLRDGFGWDAYKKVFAEYRNLKDNERPKTDDEKRDQWMVRFSRTVGRNLGPFFQSWGIPTSQAARDSIAGLPGWTPDQG